MSLEVVKMRFFDRKILDKLDKAERRAFNKIGSYIRSDARRSMRPAKPGAPPAPVGRPPRSRKGQLKKFLFYWYDEQNHDVVIGPILLPGQRVPVPGVHEHGRHVTTSRYIQKYPPRPYMRPALEKNRSKGLALFKNSLHR